jgi:hypothetical protein
MLFLIEINVGYTMPFSLLTPKDFKIIWLSNLLTIYVPDEGYSSITPCALN